MAQKKIGDVELQWTCPNCNGLNPGSASFCKSCGAAQPEDVDFHLPDRQELLADEEKIARAQAGPDIHCPFCGTRNPPGTEVCSQCGGGLGEGIKRETGKVLGAFQTGPVKMVTCPNCASENPDTALRCANCGASLAPEPKPIPQPASVPAGRKALNPLLIAGIVLIAVIVCGALVFLMLRGAQTTDVRATVERASWQRSIPIMALVAVEYQDWIDQIPADADVGSCSERVREVVDEPVANSVEICGTPYTVDTGGGFAEVVQDCSYEVYAEYCTYSVTEQRQVDSAASSGSGFNPDWPAPVLGAGESLGDARTENYTVVFVTDSGETYVYQTRNFSEYQQFQPGSSWTLVINGFGEMVGLEP